jgi:hypothetical protein
MAYNPELAKSFKKWQGRKTKLTRKDWEHYTPSLYAGFLLGLLAKPPVVLAVLSLVSLYVFVHEDRQRHKWEVSNHECECELGATMGIT